MAEPASFRIDTVALGIVEPKASGRILEFPAVKPEFEVVDFSSLATPYAAADIEKSRYNVESFALKDGGGYHPEMHLRVGDTMVSYGCDFNAARNPTWGIIAADQILYRNSGTTELVSVNLLSAFYGDRGEIDRMQLQWFGSERRDGSMLPVTEVAFSKENPAAVSISSREIADGEPIDALLGEIILVPGASAAYRVDHGREMFSVTKLNLAWGAGFEPTIIGFDIAMVSEHLEGISARLRNSRVAGKTDFLSRYPVGIAFDRPPLPALSGVLSSAEPPPFYH